MADDKKITRVKIPSEKKEIAKPAEASNKTHRTPKVLAAPGGYFVGAFREIQQVRWPNRKATWSLTLAVIIFTAFWTVVILGLDLVNQYILNRLILN